MKNLLLTILLLSLSTAYADQQSLNEKVIEIQVTEDKHDEFGKKVVYADGYKPNDYEDCPEGKEIEKNGDVFICKTQESSQGTTGALAEVLGGVLKILEVLLSL